MFHGKLIGSLGFSRRGEYIGRRARQEVGQVAPPPGGAARAGPYHPMVWLAPGSPPSLLWTLSRVGKNRNFGFCFVQFQEYFLCSFSETQKNENRELALWHLVNRLVPENA
jgi:hypothetical protein